MKINKDSVLFYSSLLNFFLGDVVTTLAQLNKFKQWITKFWDTGWEEAEKNKKTKKKNERAGYELTAFAFDGKAALESVVLEFTRLKLARLFWLLENHYTREKIR